MSKQEIKDQVERTEWAGRPMISFCPEEYRPFKIGYGKAKTILNNLPEIRKFVAEVELERKQAEKKKKRLTQSLAKTLEGVSKADLLEALKDLGVEDVIDGDIAVKKPKPEKSEKPKPAKKSETGVYAVTGKKSKRHGRCSSCKQDKWLQTKDKCRACFMADKASPAKKAEKAAEKREQRANPMKGLVAARRRAGLPPAGTATVTDDEPNKEKLCKELAELAQAFSYDSIGRLIGDGVARGTVKAWCNKARGETEHAWWPNEKRLEDLWVFLTRWKERDPELEAELTEVGGNRGWNK